MMLSEIKEKIKAAYDSRHKYSFLPLKISLLYFIISFLWILFSDELTHGLFLDRKKLLLANTYKGWVYVIVITVVIYLLLRRAFKSVYTAEKKMLESYEELSAAHEELEAANEELSASEEELKNQYHQIHKYAYSDSVTGLPNKLWLQENVSNILGTAAYRVAFLFIDLDNFKNVNDSFGHFFGDAILAEIGKLLKLIIEDNAIVARLGGDEFALVITDLEIIGRVDEFAKDILLKLDTSFREKEINIHMSASIGIAIFPDHANDFDDLLKNSDTAMYRAKSQGKNRYAVFDQSMNQELYAKVEMESNLRTALVNNELLLHYQPVYCLKTGKVHGFEALIRWKSPAYGMVPPLKFIPLAEETGLILQMGNWVLRTACNFINQINMSRKDKLFVSVNISMHQLAEDNFIQDVLNILEETRTEARYLELEITESILMINAESKSHKLEELKSLGIKVALDDFGTGYSSLTYLKKLPISILKLDKAFIDDIADNKTDYDIVRNILMLAATLGLAVVAEGVERKEQLDCLSEFGCDMVQGFFLSKPLTEDEIKRSEIF